LEENLHYILPLLWRGRIKEGEEKEKISSVLIPLPLFNSPPPRRGGEEDGKDLFSPKGRGRI